MLWPLLTTLALSTLPAEPSPPPMLTVEGMRWGEEVRSERSHPFVGVLLDAGFPDGAAAGLAIMPVSFLRLHVAGLSNGLGMGGRAGAMLVAFPRWVARPTLGVEAGYTFGGVGAWALGYVSDANLKTALSHVSVGFVTARLGLELGSRTVAFTLQAGLSWLDIGLGTQAVDFGNGSTLKASGSSLRGFVPSARLGFIFCFG